MKFKRIVYACLELFVFFWFCNFNPKNFANILFAKQHFFQTPFFETKYSTWLYSQGVTFMYQGDISNEIFSWPLAERDWCQQQQQHFLV